MTTKVSFFAVLVLSTSMAVAQHHQHGEGPPESSSKASQNLTSVGPHGGVVQQVGALRIETVVEHGGIQTFIYDKHMQPVDASGARGLATLKMEGEPKTYRYDLFADDGRGTSAESLSAAVDLSRFGGRQVELELEIVGIRQVGKQHLMLRDVATIPMTKEQLVAAAIAKQKVCPVSGQPLGSMGAPIAVQVGDQTVYVCCQGCVDAVKADGLKSASGEQPPAAAPAVTKATKADVSYVAAQKLCPVMDEPLDSMGGPYRTVVEGKIVYLCCPGCAKKLHAKPDRYLAKLTSQGIRPPSVTK